MSNEFYTKSGKPVAQSRGLSQEMRDEFTSIENGFNKFPALTGNGYKFLRINAGGTAIDATTTIDGIPIGSTTASTVRGTTVTATTGFSGPLTGDVTGNVTAGSGTSTFNNVTVNGSLDMTSGLISNLLTPSAGPDAANKTYVDTQRDTRLATAGGTMSGAIAMGSNKITGLGTPTADTDAATKLYADGVIATCRQIGKTAMYISSAITHGVTPLEISNGSAMLGVMSYDGYSDTNASFTLAMPNSWNLGTLTAKIIWCSTGTSSGGIVWKIGASSLSDNNLITSFSPTYVNIVDATTTVANTVFITPESAPITVANTPSDGDLITLVVGRLATHASDTTTQDVNMLGVVLYYTTDAPTDA